VSPSVLGLAAALAAVALYLPTLDYGWVWDDQILVATRAQGGVGGVGLRPVTSLLYRLEWALGYGAPLIFHLTSVLLHGLATWLCFRLARHVGASAWIAFAASLLFAAHPIHVEAVAYVSGRPALLATALALTSLLLARTPKLCRPDGCRSWTIWPAYAAMAAAVLSDEAALVTPLVLVGLDRWGPVSVPARRRLTHYAGFAAIALVYVAVRVALGGGMAPGAEPGAGAADEGASRGAARPPAVSGSTMEASGVDAKAGIWAAPMAAGDYLSMLVLPHPLNAMRSLTAEDAASAARRASALVALGLLALAVAWRWRDPLGRAGALLLVLPLLPALPFPSFIGGYAEERSVYYASVGFCLLVGSFYVAGWATAGSRRATAAAGIALAALAAFGTLRQMPVWRSNVALLQAAAAADPDDPTADLMLSRIFAAEENWEAALAAVDRAIGIDSTTAGVIQMRTAILSRLGRWEAAAGSARQAVTLDPRDAVSWANLCDALTQLGDVPAAVAAGRRAVESDSASVSGWYNLGVALGAAGDVPGATAAYERAVALQPDNVLALNNLASVYGVAGRLEEARDLYLRVVGLAPNSIEGRMNLALAYLRLGDRVSAAAERDRVRRLNPSAVQQLDEIFKAYTPKFPGERR
jgi:tetratricopeptide (TPR) repeat protein